MWVLVVLVGCWVRMGWMGYCSWEVGYCVFGVLFEVVLWLWILWCFVGVLCCRIFSCGVRRFICFVFGLLYVFWCDVWKMIFYLVGFCWYIFCCFGWYWMCMFWLCIGWLLLCCCCVVFDCLLMWLVCLEWIWYILFCLVICWMFFMVCCFVL